mgnify:CR=1 FL=1
MKWSDLLLEGDHAITLEEEVEGGIRFSLTAHETSHGVSGVLAGVLAGLINLTDVDLDGGVLLGAEDAVGGGALAGDVHVDNLALLVGHTDLVRNHGEI